MDDLPNSVHGLWAVAHVASQRSIRDNARHEMPCPIPGCGVDCGEFLLRSMLRLPPPIKDHGRLRFVHMARAAFASAPRDLASDQVAKPCSLRSHDMRIGMGTNGWSLAVLYALCLFSQPLAKYADESV
jgi:hypothetical protein